MSQFSTQLKQNIINSGAAEILAEGVRFQGKTGMVSFMEMLLFTKISVQFWISTEISATCV